MVIANSSEHKINWSVGQGQERGEFGGQKALKSIGNMLFMRGDGIYEKEQSQIDQQVFG
jgi:hypothetical protein